MIELKGTEKQIETANKIREKRIAELERFIADISNPRTKEVSLKVKVGIGILGIKFGQPMPSKEEMIGEITEICRKIKNIDDAAWWINNCGSPAGDIAGIIAHFYRGE